MAETGIQVESPGIRERPGQKGAQKAAVMGRVGHQKFFFYRGMYAKEEQWEIVRIFSWPLGYLVSSAAGFCLGARHKGTSQGSPY